MIVELERFRELPLWIKKQKKRGSKEWRSYSLRARLIITVFRFRWFKVYDPTLYQLDHKFSIYKGFLNNVPLEVISNKNNLELMPKTENRHKGTDCSICLSELYATYEQDERVSHLVATILRTDDEDTLTRWSLIAHHHFKQVAKQEATKASDKVRSEALEGVLV